MMTLTKTFSYGTCLALLTNVAACATSDDPADQSNLDSGLGDTSLVSDGGPDAPKDGALDVRTDSGPIDTGLKDTRPADADTCVPGSTETRACGACGSQLRICLAEGYHTAWSDCTAERGDVECKIGEKRTNDCGNCGHSTDFCDTKTCTWTTGACTGEGPCVPGDSETTKASCSVVDEVRTRTCDDKCAWSSFSSCGLPKGWLTMATSPLVGRCTHSAVWGGGKMWIWGGDSSSAYESSGGSYDLATNTWATLPGAPSVFSGGRRNLNSVWTGSKLIVFGGRNSSTPYKDAAIYDPATSTWTTTAAAPATFSARYMAAAVWSTTTNELLIWGGCTSGSCSAVASDGIAYDPVANTWTALPASPLVGRFDPAYAWNGTEMIIAGGRTVSGAVVDGARFDPVTRGWVKFSDAPAAAYDGRQDVPFGYSDGKLALFGGRNTSTTSTSKDNGAYYQAGVGWTPIASATDTDLTGGAKRFDATVWSANNKLFVYSGLGVASAYTTIPGFASYDYATSSWTAIDETGAPGPRARGTAVWTGREALIWGGCGGDSGSPYHNDGAIYRP